MKGTAITTLSDIARRAGVSSGVVSRIINNDTTLRIAEATRERVLKVIEDLDYSPNVAAQTLRSAKSGLIAVILNDVTNPVYAEIMRGAQVASVRHEKALLVFDSATGRKSAKKLAALIGGGALDALIIQSAGAVSDTVLARAASRKIATVLLQAELGIDAHLVSLPDAEAADIATEHLISNGHRNIGCIATARGLRFTRNRLAGLRRAMKRHGLRADRTAVAYASSEIEAGARACERLLDTRPDLTALVCLNVLAALGAMEAVNRNGRRIPEDISIVAIHDLPFAGVLSTPLTTVAMPLYDMGEQAVELACTDALEVGESVVGSPPLLISRQSVAALT